MSFIFNNEIKFERNEQLDSFGRLRVSNLETYFDSPLKHHEEIYIWDTTTVANGSSTYSDTNKLLTASVTSNGDSVIRQTKEYFQLQNGKSHVGFIGTVFGTTESNVTKKVGLYDDENGFYIRQLGDGTYSLVIRSKSSGSVQETVIPQSSWNIDTLDGNGISKINVDFTKLQILCFDLSYTGNGSVRFGIMVDNKILLAHQISSFNQYSVNSFTTPSLPIRYEIESTGGQSELVQQSCCILVEGGYDKRGISRSVNTGPDAIEINKETKPILSLRLKPEYRKAVIIPDSFNILHTSKKATILYEIYMFCDLVNPNWQPTQLNTNCIAEYDVSASDFSGGILIDSGYLSSESVSFTNSKLDNILKLSGNNNGDTDIITIVISSEDDKAPCYASLKYFEIY